MEKLQQCFKRKNFVNGNLVAIKRSNENSISFFKAYKHDEMQVVEGMVREKIFTNRQIKSIIKCEMGVM